MTDGVNYPQLDKQSIELAIRRPARQRAEAGASFVIAATFTAEPVEASLSYWLEQFGLPHQIRFAPFNQVFQALLDPRSLLRTNEGGTNILLVRPQDWLEAFDEQKQAFTADDWRQRLSSPVEEFILTVKRASESAIPLIVMVCPPSEMLLRESAVAETMHDLECRISQGLGGVGGIHVVTSAATADFYPVVNYYDAKSEYIGRIPYTPVYFAAMGTMLARTALAIRRPPCKAIALDCDNTLWRGVCGEGGVAAVAVSESFRELQRFCVSQSKKGKLLCLCSKNVEQDVFDIFDNHPGMVLTRDRLVSWRINWNPKSQNLRDLASELNLGIDSFVFLDDNPVECAEVRANAPQVLALKIPDDTAKIPRFLRHIWALDQLTVSDQDLKRTLQYQQNARRESVRRESSGLGDFLARLALEVDIHPVTEAELSRAAQLTVRTNQFNASTIRRGEGELRQLSRDGGHRCVVAHVKDRFGDYGLVGLMILRPEPVETALVVDTLLLSCRVLGRGVEHQLIAHAGQLAMQLQLERLNVGFVPTSKNRPMLDFLESIAAAYRVEQPNGDAIYSLPAEMASRIEATVASAPPSDEPGGMISSSSSDGLQGISRDELYALYERIALDLNEPTEILRAIDAHARRSTAAGIDRAPFVAPRTDGERQMLDIWRNVLNVDSLSIKDDYFKLGGTSVMAVRLVLEIERVFNRRLEIATLLQAPTVESLTRELHKTVVDDPLAMVALRPGSAHAPLFLLPGVGGHGMSFRELARLVTIENAIYAMEMRPELEHNRRPRAMEHIAAEFIGRINAVTPFGPILLAGWSFGGALAFEVAQQLTAAGREVAIVLLFDTYGPGFPRALPTRQRILAHASNLLRLSSAQRLQYIVSRFRSTCRLIRHQWRKLSGWREVDFIAEEDPNLREMVAHSEAAWAGYCPKPLPVRLTLIRAQHHDSRVGITYDDPYNGWGPFAADGIDVYPVDAAHLTLFEPPAVAAVAAALTKCVLTACQQCPTSG